MNNIIVIGCPIRNRGWILPLYLKHIYNLNYDKKSIILKFLLNDCSKNDTSESILNEFKSDYIHLYKDIIIDKEDYGHPTDERLDRKNRGVYKAFAIVRNKWKTCNFEYDYLFSVDSDILLHPETLNILLESFNMKRDAGMVSALISNDISGRGIWQQGINNTMLSSIRKNYRCDYCTHLFNSEYPEWCLYYINNPQNGNFICDKYIRNQKKLCKTIRYKKPKINSILEVEYTGACALIPSNIANICDYEEHTSGEDYKFCANIKSLGYKIYCNSNVNPRHIMHISWLNDLDTCPELGYINFGNYIKIVQFNYCEKNTK